MGLFTTTLNLFKYIVNGRKWEYKIIHQPSLSRLPVKWSLSLLSSHLKSSLKCPDNLRIVLIHNYDKPSLAEVSLNYLGIEKYTVLKPKVNDYWKNSNKIIALHQFLAAENCNEDYILYLDSSDVVLRADLNNVISYFQQQDCDLLYSNTSFTLGYECMKDVKLWTQKIAQKHGNKSAHINTGVYIGKTYFLREVLDKAIKFVTPQDLTPDESYQLIRNNKLCKKLPEFPKGVGSDQMIIRYLYPKFYPRMKIDYQGKLALRT